MDPRRLKPVPLQRGFPRTRGDGPHRDLLIDFALRVSPHTRGWTPSSPKTAQAKTGFPAHAGMDRGQAAATSGPIGFPRTRGDGPDSLLPTGETERVSPHTRGWTPPRRHPRSPLAGFPAHAGMDPAGARWRQGCAGFPRTRGDGPVDPSLGSDFHEVSPHTRGWTLGRTTAFSAGQGFPAHAGMDPTVSCSRRTRSRFPRTRGDGPLIRFTGGIVRGVSPHTRGWTPVVTGGQFSVAGFPAHAGMDPDD